MLHRGLVFLSLVLSGCGGGIGSGSDAGPLPDAGDAGDPVDAGDQGPPLFEVGIDGTVAVAELTERYVSFTVDIDRMLINRDGTIGIDFTVPRLRALAQNLAPAVMRVGGTKADKAYFDQSDPPLGTAPAPYRHLLRQAIWDDACDFANALGFDIAFTLNAGDGTRDAEGRWTPDAARTFIEHATDIGCPVSVWELGNEVSAFAGVGDGVSNVSPEQYAADFATARALIDEIDSDARLAGPASGYFPIWGEVTLIDRFLPRFVEGAGDALDVITWHYYPTQPRDYDLVSRPSSLETLLDPETLDEVVAWADEVEQAGSVHAPGAEVWLGETASALDGGVEELSDRYGAGLWWLDQLALLASHGEQIVARQSLTGGRYHLIDADTLEPYPDYFNSLLFRAFMGTRVLARPTATPTPPSTFDPTLVRTYAHCTPHRPGAVTVLALNLSQYGPATLSFPDVDGARELYLATATTGDWLGTEVALNGTVLTVGENGDPPDFDPVDATDPITLPPVSYAFIVLPAAAAAACP